MANSDPDGSMTDPNSSEGRDRGSRRRKVFGYLKAANELRQSYQTQWAQSRGPGDEYESGVPGSFPDVEMVRNGDEEMVLFPSYARRHIKIVKGDIDEKPGADEDIAHPENSGDAEYWKKRWEEYEDENAVVDIDVRGWIYSPHKGPLTRKNRLLIAVARRLSGIPAPAPSPGHSRDPSRSSRRQEEDEAARREAQSIVQRGEGEAAAAVRGRYSEGQFDHRDTFRRDSPRSDSPERLNKPLHRQLRQTKDDSTPASDSEDSASEALTYAPTSLVFSEMSQEELARANTSLMSRLMPFMHLPLTDAPITVFFYNDEKSQSRSINTNDSGHFLLRASLDFVPTSIRVLASEELSVTEKVIITDPRGVSLISDIDDTIKHSAISAGAKEIFNNTFIRDLDDLTIKGVREWYSKLASLGVQLHYVSNSPWQLFPLLRSYFSLAGLPPGSFHLKQYSGMLQGIFEPAAERKRGSLDKIAKDFPERQFLLVGDSGEADLEVYSDFVLANPGRVLGIFIRDVTTPSKKNLFDPPSSIQGASKASTQTSTGQQQKDDRSDAPEARPLLPSRPSAKPQPKAGSPKDLIDFGEDVDDRTETSGNKRGLESSSESSKRSGPPSRPSKPPALRSSSTQHPQSSDDRPLTDERSTDTTLDTSSVKKSVPPPPPPPRRSSSLIDPPTPRTPFSSEKQNQNRTPPPPNSSLSPNQSRPEEADGYTAAARRGLVSAYNTLPSARTLWSGSPHATAAASQAQAAANRTSWGPSGSGGGNESAAEEAPYYNKKEEIWKRRWARAEEVMRREGVVLKTWRVGADVMDASVALCEKAMEEIRRTGDGDDKLEKDG